MKNKSPQQTKLDNQKTLSNILKASKITKLKIGELSFLKGVNREVNEKKVEKLKNKIISIGEFLGVFIVAKNPHGAGYIVLDAQHRYSVFLCLPKDMMINCIISQAKTMTEIVNVMKLLNSTNTPWNSENYINAFAGLNIASYKELKKAAIDKVLTSATLPMLLSKESRTVTRELIMDGKFIIANKNWESNLTQIKECKSLGVIPVVGNTVRIYMEALVLLVLNKDYNHDKFIFNLKKQDKNKFILETVKMEAAKVCEYYLTIQNGKTVKKETKKTVLRKAA
jgi:hypothetical protein